MTKNIFRRAALFVLLSAGFVIISCGSTPPVEPVPELPPPTQPELPPAPVPNKAAEDYARLLPETEAARERAVAAGAEETSPDEIAEADDAAGEGKTLGGNGAYDAAIDMLRKAISAYNEAADAAHSTWLGRALDAKSAADEAKAASSFRAQYEEAEAALAAAESAWQAENYQDARLQYEAASAKFGEAAALANNKRAAAEAALAAAEKKVAESGEIAAEVEKELLRADADEGVRR